MNNLNIRTILIFLSLLATVLLEQTSEARLPNPLEVGLSRVLIEVSLLDETQMILYQYSQKSLNSIFDAAKASHPEIVQAYLEASEKIAMSVPLAVHPQVFSMSAMQGMINTVFFIKLLQAPDVAISNKKLQTRLLNRVFLSRLDAFMGDNGTVAEEIATERFHILSETLGSYRTPEDAVIARDLLEQWTRIHALPNRGLKRAILFPFKFVAATSREIIGLFLPIGWGEDWGKYGGWAINAAVWAAAGLSYEAVHLHSIVFAVPAGALDFVFGYIGLTNSFRQATAYRNRYSPEETQDKLVEAKKLLGRMDTSLESDCTLTLKQL